MFGIKGSAKKDGIKKETKKEVTSPDKYTTPKKRFSISPRKSSSTKASISSSPVTERDYERKEKPIINWNWEQITSHADRARLKEVEQMLKETEKRLKDFTESLSNLILTTNIYDLIQSISSGKKFQYVLADGLPSDSRGITQQVFLNSGKHSTWAFGDAARRTVYALQGRPEEVTNLYFDADWAAGFISMLSAQIGDNNHKLKVVTICKIHDLIALGMVLEKDNSLSYYLQSVFYAAVNEQGAAFSDLNLYSAVTSFIKYKVDRDEVTEANRNPLLGIAQEMDNCIAYFKEIESDEIPKEKEGMLKNLGEKIFIEKLTIENITSLMKLGKDFETASEKIERMLGEKDNPVIKKIQERFGAGSSEALEDSGKRLMLSILFGSDSDLPSEKVLYSQSGSEKIDELAVSYIEEFVQKSSESSDMFSAKGFKNYMAKHKTNIDRKSGQDRGPISRGSVVDNDSSQVVIPSSSSSCSSTSAPSSSCSTSSSSTSTLVEQVEQIAEQRVT